MESKVTAEEKIYAQGYVAALVNMLSHSFGKPDKVCRDVWRALGYEFDELKNLGIQARDLRVMEQHREYLTH